MKPSELVPMPVCKAKFDYSAINIIPKKMGCYALCSFNNDILYVGLANNLSKRIGQHLNDIKKLSLTKYGKSFWFYYLELKSEKDILRTERGWINQYLLKHGEFPPMNKIHSPVS